MAVVKGVPAAALAYHNPGGALVDDPYIASSEEATLDSGQVGTADGGISDEQAGDSCRTAGVEGGGGGSNNGGGSVGACSSRFRCVCHQIRTQAAEHSNNVSLEWRARITSSADHRDSTTIIDANVPECARTGLGHI